MVYKRLSPALRDCNSRRSGPNPSSPNSMGWSLSASTGAGLQLGWPWHQPQHLPNGSSSRMHSPTAPTAFVSSRAAPWLNPCAHSGSSSCSSISTRGLGYRAMEQSGRYRLRHYRRGQCLMGVKGLYNYLQKEFVGAAPVERLREVCWSCDFPCTPWLIVLCFRIGSQVILIVGHRTP